jgi:predicted enzyme related to lactoylglutathione lyase
MADASHRGEFVWHDLLTPNAAGAHEFYGKVVGWTAQPWESDPSYVLFAAPSGPVGGVVESRAATPHWVTYIGTGDLDATVEGATRLGATVQTAPTPLPGGGRYATLADPQGATFGIHESGDSTEGAAASPKTGEFSWHELSTSVSPNIAFGFYAALFDWDEISQTDMGPMGMYLIFGRNGRQIGGMFDHSASGKPGNAYWLGYVSVTDVDDAVERATGARGSVLTGPMDVPGGDRVAQLMDPHGAFFALHKAAAKGAAAASNEAPAHKPAKKAAAKPAPRKAAAKKPAARQAAAKKRPAKKKPATSARPARKAAANKPAAKKQAAARKPAKSKAKAKTKAKPKKTTKKAKKRGR